MGGCCCCCCCCCASKSPEFNRSPTYFRHPVVEERGPLSSEHATVSAFSTGFVVDTNLDTSFADTYRPPPVPIPYEAYVDHPPTLSVTQGHSENKSEVFLQTSNSELVEDRNFGVNLNTKLQNLESDEKSETDVDLTASNEEEDENFKELKKSKEPFVPPLQNDEDVCPTCLEEYDKENPKISTKCDHHFHLACILEWMERSDTCPVCDQEMVFSPAMGG